GDEQLVHAADADDVAGLGLFDFNTLQTGVAHDLENTTLALLAVGTDGHHRGVALDFAAGDTANTDHTQEAVVVQLGDLHLERAIQVNAGRRYVVDDGLEQGVHVLVEVLVVHTGNAVQGAGVDDREVQLLLIGTQVVEQVEYLIHTQSGRAPGRSILLITTMGLRPAWKAFWVTNRVCGMGPSIESTTSSTQSTMLITRSTSPPKSAWPGVSTMLIW